MHRYDVSIEKKNLLKLTLHKHKYLFLPDKLLPNMLNTHAFSTWSAQVFINFCFANVFKKDEKKFLPRSFFYSLKPVRPLVFFFHPVLGCIGIKANALRDARKWVDKCAEDGGELILINLAAEDQALANIFGN